MAEPPPTEKQKLEQAESRGGPFVEAVEATRAPMLVTDPTAPGNPIIYANSAFTDLFGYGRDEAVGRGYALLSGPGADPDLLHELELGEALAETTRDVLLYAKDGRPIWASLLVLPILEDGRVVRQFCSLIDISNRVERERRIEELAETLEAKVEVRTRRLEGTMRRLRDEIERRRKTEAVLRDTLADNQRHLQEKSELAKEVDHRAKNAIQLVMSLLQVQSGRTDNPETRTALKQAIERLAWVAEAHAMLYQGEDPAHIDLGDYLRRLAPRLLASMQIEPGRIDLQIDGDDALWPPDLVVPLGLIVSEAITNAMKYAFPDARRGRLQLSFGIRQPEAYLRVEDDGVGFPGEVGPGGLGLKLIDLFARQIHGEAKVEPGPAGGVRVSVTFPAPPTNADLASAAPAHSTGGQGPGSP